MNLRKTIRVLLSLALAVVGKTTHSEEQHSIMTAISSTTLSGYVDTSASWWVGGGGGLPGRTFDPANDSAPDAIAVETNNIAIPANLADSTLDVGEPVQPGQTGSIWYKWTASQTGVARIATTAIAAMPQPATTSTMPARSDESIFYPWGGIGYGWDGGYGSVFIFTFNPPGLQGLVGFYRWWTDLVVYRAVRVSDTEIRFEFVQRGASLQFDAQEGETFWVGVEVYERQPAFEGQIELPSALPSVLNFDLTPPAANDSFASNFSVADSSGGTMTGYAPAATREAGEPDLGGEFSGGSVWFHYTAATYGTVAISDASQNLPLAIFTGTTVSNLSLVAKSSAGGIAFFAEEGKQYHVAVYRGVSTAGFNLSFVGPRYRLYETAFDALMPNGLTPHFYGVRGSTMLMYAKRLTGWDLVEVEPIANQAADLLTKPASALDGQLRVLTIDETLPSPHVTLRNARGWLVADIVGIPGQTCAISYSSDLANWSEPEVTTLKASTTAWRAFSPNANYFFRITQSLPIPPMTQIPIGVVHTGVGGGNVPPPPAP